MSVAVAIVGSGTAGCYAAGALLKKLPGCRVDIIERLPTPFGLIRGGIAPDHQSTKNVARVFEKTLDREGVRLLGYDIATTQAHQAGQLYGWLAEWGLRQLGSEPPMMWMVPRR